MKIFLKNIKYFKKYFYKNRNMRWDIKEQVFLLKMRCGVLEKTVCELFAGVGGFRCGLNDIKTIEDTKKEEKWDTVWFSQWEPAE